MLKNHNMHIDIFGFSYFVFVCKEKLNILVVKITIFIQYILELIF